MDSAVRILLGPDILINMHYPNISHGERVKRSSGDQMPVVFLPEETETECVAQNRMSSFGFLAFVVQSINAVVNVANNINDNNNNRNNNNNDNNNNQVILRVSQNSDVILFANSPCTGHPFFWAPCKL